MGLDRINSSLTQRVQTTKSSLLRDAIAEARPASDDTRDWVEQAFEEEDEEDDDDTQS